MQIRIPLATLIINIGLISGCANSVAPHNDFHGKNVDADSMPVLSQRLADESKKLFAQNAQLRAALNKTKKAIELPEAIAPIFDPLEAITITIDVDNEDVQNVLRAIALQSGLNLLIDPELASLQRKITMHLTQAPARQVFDNLIELLDLSSSIENNLLIVRPFEERIFHLDFIQTVTNMEFDVGGDVFGANRSSGSGGGGGDGGSSNSMTGNLTLTGGGNNNSDPYRQLENMLEQIIGKNADSSADEQTNNLLSSIAGAQVKSGKPIYTLNQMTGTLYVRARNSQILAIENLIRQYKEVLQRQVLIEAQIIDVSLFDRYQFGIDWSVVRSELVSSYGLAGASLDGFSSTLPNAVVPGDRLITLPATAVSNVERGYKGLYSNGTFTAAIDVLRNFGVVRMLSSPSIRAKNAIPAFFSVGRNSRYIAESTSSVQNAGGGASTTSASITTSSVFDGIMLGVTPFISKNGDINLTIHPMQSSVDEQSLALIDAGSNNKVTLPVIDFKGLTTSLSLRDGDTVILGGLIDEKGSNVGDGLPGLTDLPGPLGALFGKRGKRSNVREMAIVIRVSLI